MTLFNNDYDAGFLNVPGFGQSVTNPLAPVFYQSLGIVKDLSVYQSIYAAKNINAGASFNVGKSSMSLTGLNIGVPGIFEENVNFEQNAQFEGNVVIKGNLIVGGTLSAGNLIVGGKRYGNRTIKAENGTFQVLAS